MRGRALDFGGAAVGKALREFGGDLTKTARDLIAIQEDRRERDDALAGAKALAEARIALTERFGQLRQDAPEGAPDFAIEARRVVQEEIQNRQETLSPQAQRAFAARFANLTAGFVEQAIKFETKARARKQARDLAGTVDLQLNAIRSDPGQFVSALAEATGAIAASELPAEFKRDQWRDLQDRAARMALEALNENDPLAAEAALERGEFDGFLRPETKNDLVNNNKVELRRREAQLKAMERETEGLVARQVDHAIFVLARGRVPPGLAATKQQAAAFPDLARTLDHAMRDADLMAEFLRTPPAAQAARIEALGARKDLTRREVARLDLMGRVHVAAVKALQSDPLGYAAEIDVIEDVETLDFAEPATLARRKVQARVAAAFFQVPVPLLRPAEADAMTRALDSAEGDRLAALFQSLSFGFGSDSLDGLADQIAPKRPAVAVALSRAADAPLIASEIARGDRLARRNPDVKPSAGEREPLLAEVYAGLFREVPDALRHFEAAALALYALRKVPSGDLSFDAGLFEDALRLAAGGRIDVDGEISGGPVEFNDQLVLPPRPGMDEDAFAELVESLTPEEMTRFGNGAPVFGDGGVAFTAERFDLGIFEPGDDAQLLTAGNGIYKVWVPGLGYVATPAGVTYKLDLRRVMRARGLP